MADSVCCIKLSSSNACISVFASSIIDCYRAIDPTQFTDIYNDIWLKKYTTAKIKKQWGTNLSKFEGVVMAGGITLNGRSILEDANTEIQALEEESLIQQTESAIMIG
jgi:hypothetical protein